MVDQLSLIRQLETKTRFLAERVKILESAQKVHHIDQNRRDKSDVIIECEDDNGATNLTSHLLVAISSFNTSTGKPKVKLAGQSVSSGNVFGVVIKPSFNSIAEVQIGLIATVIYDTPGAGDTAFASVVYGDVLKASSNNNGKGIVNNSLNGNAGMVLGTFTLDAVNYVITQIKGSSGSDVSVDELTVTKNADGEVALFGDDCVSLMVYQRKGDGTFNFDWVRAS